MLKRATMTRRPGGEQGVMLLEALLGILIFSIGILALVAMQGLAITYVADAKYRTDASFLASSLIGQMWVDRANLANYNYQTGGTPPAALTAWVNKVDAALPQAASLPPIVAVNAATGNVSVTIRWQQPGSSNSSVRQYQAVALISSP